MIIAKSKIPQTHNRTAELKIGVKVGDRRITVKHRAGDDGPADLDMTSPARKPEEKIYSLLAPGVAPSVGRRLLARRCHNIIASSSFPIYSHPQRAETPHPEWPRWQFARRVCLVTQRDMHPPFGHGSGALPISFPVEVLELSEHRTT